MTGGLRRSVVLALASLVAAGCGGATVHRASSDGQLASLAVPLNASGSGGAGAGPAVRAGPAAQSAPAAASGNDGLSGSGTAESASLATVAAGPPDLGPAPLPPAHPADQSRLRVLLVGDGVMYDAAPGLSAAFASTGRAAVTDGSHWGLGLTQDGGWGWPAQWATMISTVHPNVVVVLLGKWDAMPAQVNGQLLVPGSPEWAQWYRTQVDSALRILTNEHAEVVWLGMSPENVPGSAPATAALNSVLRDATAAWPAATFVDTTTLLGGDAGQYVQTIPGPTGPLTLRKPDGVHLCPDGVIRLADAAVGGVAAEPQLSPAPGWEAGAWRHDGRYYWAPGGGCPGS